MNGREFAAAHDRWLEPPEEGPENSAYETDEDFAYDTDRQRRIDEEDWRAETLRQRQESGNAL